MGTWSTCRWCVLWSAMLSAVCVNAREKANKSAIGRHPRQTADVGLEGVWGPWSKWTECSQSCGVGVTERRRQCVAPPQSQYGPSYMPFGGLSHSPSHPSHIPYYPPSYSGNDRIYPANQSPGLPLYRNTPEEIGEELPNHTPPLYRRDVMSPNEQPISIYRSSSSSRAYSQSGRGSRRPVSEGTGSIGATGSRTLFSNNRDQASARRPIRPGQFGYGRVPYSLPLHRQNRHARYTRPDGNGTAETLNVKPTVATQHLESQHKKKVERKDTNPKERQKQRAISRRAPPPVLPPFSSPLHRPHPDAVPFDTPPYLQPPVVSHQHYRCSGKDREMRKCTEEECLANQVDPRAEQCAAFNINEFMGRVYDWEPFTEGTVEQQCELTCRPVGYRFYVRHAERVRDGTPCVNKTLNDVCVGGQCLSEGCDGMLDSGMVRDHCGVCGGSEGSCVQVAGSFLNRSVPLGYHKILDIPAGATAINITERSASPNYIALRSGTGQSIVNGRWAVDPPGNYEAGGTTFVYTRNHGETLTAPGPTNSLLQLYIIFHKENPGVDYKYYIPLKKDTIKELDRGSLSFPETSAVVAFKDSAPSPVSSSSALTDRWTLDRPLLHNSGPSRNARIPPRTDIPLDSRSPFVWMLGQLTECSASCGKGFQHREVLCVNRHTNEEVQKRSCDSASKPNIEEEPCNIHPCPPYWEAGEWSECSVSCGWGLQQRQLQCRQNFSSRSTRVHPQRCHGLTQPNTTQACHTLSCSHWQITSNWSVCSVNCGAGKKTRSIRCVSDHGRVVSDGECNARLRPQVNEDCHMGPCVSNWYFNDWTDTCSTPCGPGVQKRDVMCVSNGADSECVREKPAEMMACNLGPCVAQAHWFAGPWGQCSTPCGNGTQRRDVICVQKFGNDFGMISPSQCVHLEKPPPIQTCEMEACRAQWFTTEWSSCSKSCGVGAQTRDVRCLTPDKEPSSSCDPTHRPHPEQPCNSAPCSSSLEDESCKDRRANCLMVVQARLCVYSYYKTVCCSSCTQNAQRAKRH